MTSQATVRASTHTILTLSFDDWFDFYLDMNEEIPQEDFPEDYSPKSRKNIRQAFNARMLPKNVKLFHCWSMAKKPITRTRGTQTQCLDN